MIMEYLDIYDEEGNYLGKEDRDIVHRDALWHKLVHCWLYDKEGNVYFQIRKEENQLYTTASGHVRAGETLKEAFGREIKEETGVDIDYDKAILVEVVRWILDKKKKDGSMFRDRAFSSVYVCEYTGNILDFDYGEDELNGLVRVNAKAALGVLKDGAGEIDATKVVKIDNKITIIENKVCFNDFLVNPGETAIGKYGNILMKVIDLTRK